MRVGVIGVGGHGRGRHLIPLTRTPGARVVAVCDTNPATLESVCREFHVAGYMDFKEMIEREGLEAVSIATPSGLHHRIAVECLRRGVHALVDKPLGASLQEVAEVVRAAKQANKVLMVGFWSRFSPALRYGVELYESGTLGEPYYAYGYLVRRRGIPGKPTFIDKELSGGKGVLLDIGCYMLDNILALTGFRRPVSACGAVYTKFGKDPEEIKFNWGWWDPARFELEDFAAGFVRFDNGMTLTIETAWAANVSHRGEVGRLRVLGEKGGIEAEGHEALQEIGFYSRTKSFLTDTKPLLPNADLSFEMTKAFIRSIQEGTEPPVTGWQSVILHAIMDAIYESASAGREVRINLPEI
ncbi:MAG: Gfo/Idh/MocA family oxidoreductase [Nitrososphaerota archaeon]|nr:Gfo/Idh/MocA family oxidoreductase [Candidatus Calditenuaceae archaeon]MDW8072634.1 Gfo/Idh/MocA family oxidoreductase [Nitrososphaerota archaeon]